MRKLAAAGSMAAYCKLKFAGGWIILAAPSHPEDEKDEERVKNFEKEKKGMGRRCRDIKRRLGVVWNVVKTMSLSKVMCGCEVLK